MDEQEEITNHPFKRAHLITVSAIILITIVASIFVKQKTNNSVVEALFVNSEKTLHSTNGTTNLVFMGKGSINHKAADLTDSMMFISLIHSTHKITIIPIPRDTWVNTMKAKINTAYYYGNERRMGGGLDLAKSAISEITGQPVHYAIALDFAGFIELINIVGGIEVNVNNSFDDYKYPIPGLENVEPEEDRYEHLHFEAGPQHMDGGTALKFARSRHAEGDEGTDFARSARQQKIISAFKDKIISTETLFNFQTIQQMFESIYSSIDTDIKSEEYAGFFNFFLGYHQSNQSINPGNLENYLTNPPSKSPYKGQWVLVPENDWEEVYEYVDSLLQ